MDHSTRRLERKIGIGTLVLFLFSWAAFLVGLNMVTLVAWWLGVLGPMMPTPENLVALTSAPTPTWLLLMAALLQFVGMFTITMVGVWCVGRVRRRKLREVRSNQALFSQQLGLNHARAMAWAAAIAGGLSVGWLPGWIAHWIRQHLPGMDLGALAGMSDSLTTGGWASQFGMVLVVAVVAPIIEELVFRGWIWSALSRWLPSWAVVLGTALLFGAFHIDPAQGLPLVLTGVFLGWVRLTTGSVGPCIAAHLANNALAVYLAQHGSTAPSTAYVLITVVVTLTMFHTLLRTPQTTRALVTSP